MLHWFHVTIERVRGEEGGCYVCVYALERQKDKEQEKLKWEEDQ